MKKQIFITTLIIFSTMFNLFGQNNAENELKQIYNKIYPIIKVQEIDSNSDIVIEMTGENEPVFKKITDDLLCFYGIDKGTHFELLLKSNLPKQFTIEKLDSISQENLLKEIEPNLKIHPLEFGGFGFTCGGEYEASLLALPEIWNLITERLGKSIVFNVPSKDLIMFVNLDNLDGIKGLKSVNNEIHIDGERLLSKHLYKYENGKIELFE